MKKWLFIPLALALLVLSGYAWKSRHKADASARGNVLLASAIDHPQFAGEIGDARRSGIVTRLSEVYPTAPSSPENAAPLYAKIGEIDTRRPITYFDFVNIGGMMMVPKSNREWPVAQSFETRHLQMLQLAQTAAGYKECFVSHPLSFPILGPCHSAGYLLALQSLLLAHDGKTHEAEREAELGLQVARHAESERAMVAFSDTISIESITLRAMQRTMVFSDGDPVVAASVKHSLDTQWRTPSLADSLRTEIAFDSFYMDKLRTGGPNALTSLPTPTPEIGELQQSPPRNWDRYVDVSGTYLMKMMRNSIAVADSPFHESLPTLERLQSDLYNSGSDPGGYEILTRALYPAVVSAAERRSQVQVKADITRAAAAVFIYKAKHGSYPSTLGEALSPIPYDPFNSQPLHYRRVSGGFALFSVGTTQTDDLGALYPPQPGEERFIYPDPVSLPVQSSLVLR